jgi:hypothetical protein
MVVPTARIMRDGTAYLSLSLSKSLTADGPISAKVFTPLAKSNKPLAHPAHCSLK